MQVTDACYKRDGKAEFLAFMKQVAKVTRDASFRSYSTSATPTSTQKFQAWLAKNPRITLHFTPTSGSG
ncbi:MAG: transposase [Frankiales bacterium]|nr:transposase [Frankiales bacterium]